MFLVPTMVSHTHTLLEIGVNLTSEEMNAFNYVYTKRYKDTKNLWHPASHFVAF